MTASDCLGGWRPLNVPPEQEKDRRKEEELVSSDSDRA